MEKSESGHESINRRKEPKSVEHGGDEANKGEKAKTKTWSEVVKGLWIEDELKTTNSNESGNKSETTDSVRMFDSETPNQLKAMQRKGQYKRHQYHNSKGAKKGRMSRQADRKGQGVRNRTGRGGE